MSFVFRECIEWYPARFTTACLSNFQPALVFLRVIDRNKLIMGGYLGNNGWQMLKDALSESKETY